MSGFEPLTVHLHVLLWPLSYITFICLFQKYKSIYSPKSSAIRLQGNFCTSLLLLIAVLRRCTKPPFYYSLTTYPHGLHISAT